MDSNKSKNTKNEYLGFYVIGIITIVYIVLIIIFSNFFDDKNNNVADWNLFGDSFGFIAGIACAFALIYSIKSYKTQREELQFSRESQKSILEEQRKIFYEQEKIFYEQEKITRSLIENFEKERELRQHQEQEKAKSIISAILSEIQNISDLEKNLLNIQNEIYKVKPNKYEGIKDYTGKMLSNELEDKFRKMQDIIDKIYEQYNNINKVFSTNFQFIDFEIFHDIEFIISKIYKILFKEKRNLRCEYEDFISRKQIEVSDKITSNASYNMEEPTEILKKIDFDSDLKKIQQKLKNFNEPI